VVTTCFIFGHLNIWFDRFFWICVPTFRQQEQQKLNPLEPYWHKWDPQQPRMLLHEPMMQPREPITTTNSPTTGIKDVLLAPTQKTNTTTATGMGWMCHLLSFPEECLENFWKHPFFSPQEGHCHGCPFVACLFSRRDGATQCHCTSCFFALNWLSY